jgi:SAM-dependent methyltransferase
MAVRTWSTPVTDEERRPVPCTLCGFSSFVPHFTVADPSGSFSYVRCKTCGLVQINPQPAPGEVRSRYGAKPDRQAKPDRPAEPDAGADYLAYERRNEEAFLRLQRLALEDAGFFRLERELFSGTASPGVPAVLDIGCATGALLGFLKERRWSVRGLEISLPQAEYCRRRGLEVHPLPLEESPFPAASFDAALASHLIEHLNDPGNFVRELRRILKPGGRFYVTTPNITGLQARIFGSRWRSAIFDHLYLFSARTLRALLEREGFLVERTVTWGGLAGGIAPGPVKRIADTLAKALGAGDVMIMRSVLTAR